MGEITKNDDGSVTVALDYPVVSKDAATPPLAVVTIKRATAADLLRADEAVGGVRKLQLMLQGMAQMVPSTFAKLDASDVSVLDEVVAGLLGKSKG